MLDNFWAKKLNKFGTNGIFCISYFLDVLYPVLNMVSRGI